MGLSGLQTELQTDTLQGNMGKPVPQADTSEETDTISLILLALASMELYIDAANLAFPSLIRCSLLA